MADTTAQMNGLKQQGTELAVAKGHVLGEYKEFVGGAVNVALCGNCTRHVIVELYSAGNDIRGSAVTKECK